MPAKTEQVQQESSVLQPLSPQSVQLASSVSDDSTQDIEDAKKVSRTNNDATTIQPWPSHEKQLRKSRAQKANPDRSTTSQAGNTTFFTASQFYQQACLPNKEAEPLQVYKGLPESSYDYADQVARHPSPSSLSLQSLLPEEIPSMNIRDLQRKPVYRKKAPSALPYSSPGFSLLGIPESASAADQSIIDRRLQSLSSAIRSVKSKNRAVSVKVESSPPPQSQQFPPAGPVPWSGWNKPIKEEEEEIEPDNPLQFTRRGNENRMIETDRKLKVTSQSTRRGLPKFKREDIDYGLAEVLAGSGTPLSLK